MQQSKMATPAAIFVIPNNVAMDIALAHDRTERAA